MKKLLWIVGIVLVITGVFSFDQKVSATLSISGDVITDSDTGLEWLAMSRTTNKSPERIAAGDYGLSADGWVLATIPQIQTLFANAGWTGSYGGFTPWNFGAAHLLIELMGYTYEYNGPYGLNLGIQAFAGPVQPNAVSVNGAWITEAFTSTGDVGGADFLTYPPNIESPGFGNWLVRGAVTSNSPPVASLIGGGDYELLSPVILGGQISDLDGDMVIFKWREGAAVFFSGQIQTIKGGTPVDLPPVTILSGTGGIHYFTLEISDGVNPPVYTDMTVSIVDTIAPTLVPIPDKTILWPPNNKMVDVNIAANATDNSGGPVTLDIITVWSNEPGQGLYDNPINPDWTKPAINPENGTISLKLRAVRCKDGSPRIYTIRITAIDPYGNYAVADVDVIVPHDKGKY